MCGKFHVGRFVFVFVFVFVFAQFQFQLSTSCPLCVPCSMWAGMSGSHETLLAWQLIFQPVPLVGNGYIYLTQGVYGSFVTAILCDKDIVYFNQ